MSMLNDVHNKNIHRISHLFLTILCLISLSLLTIPSSFSSFYIENTGDAIFFTNKTSPSISVILESTDITTEDVRVEGIKVNSNNYALDPNVLPEIPKGESRSFNFTLDDIFSNTSKVSVEIIIRTINEDILNSDLNISGITYFNVENINSLSQISSYSLSKEGVRESITQDAIKVSSSQDKLYIYPNNALKSYSIFLNDTIVKTQSTSSLLVNDLISEIELDVSELEEGENKFRIEFVDLLENTNTQNISLNKAQGDLRITNIKTKSQDPTTPYYFNSEFSVTDVYSNSKNFNFIFETSHVASCYQIISSGGFRENFDDPEQFSDDSLSHSLNIQIPDSNQRNNVWVKCIYSGDEFLDNEEVFLSQALFNTKSLINFKYLNFDTPLQISDFYPRNEVTYSPVSIGFKSNHEALCQVEQDGSYFNVNSSDFKNHQFKDFTSIENGEVDVEVKCVNKLGSISTLSYSFTVDKTSEIRIIDYEPKRIGSLPTNIDIEVSNPNAECTLVTDPLSIGTGDLIGSLPTQKNGNIFTYSNINSNLISSGNNDIKIICNYNSRETENQISVKYSPNAPTIDSVTILNNENDETSVFSTIDFMRIQINSNSTDIQYYIINFPNSNITINTSRENIKIIEDFSKDSSFTVIAYDDFSRKSSTFTKSFSFDFTAPIITIVPGSSTSTRRIQCSDNSGSCEKVLYATSVLEESCTPSITLINNTQEVDIFGENYICVLASDSAGNKNISIERLTLQNGGFNPQNPINPIADPNQNINSTPTIPESDDDDNNDDSQPSTGIGGGNNNPGFESPFDPIEEESGINWIILSSFAFIILLIGAGGYYAYSRGYLDDQLEKIGVKKHNIKPMPTYTNIDKKPLPQSNPTPQKESKPIKDSKYDEHVDKLNDFINQTLNKNSEVFDKFNTKSTKGNIDSFKDTLIKNKKSLDDEKGEFESFYKNKKTKK